MFKTYVTFEEPVDGNFDVCRILALYQKITSPACSPSKPNSANFFCLDLSVFFLSCSSCFFSANTFSIGATSNGGGT